MRFRELFLGLVPSWLRDGDGARLLYSIGLLFDGFAERMRLSQEASDPSTAPSDALPYIGRDRRIVRGRNESNAAYAARLVRYLDDHRTQGNPYALMDQLYAYLQTECVTLRTVDRRGNWYERALDGTRTCTITGTEWEWDDLDLSHWARFWVIIFSDEGPWDIEWDPTGSGGAVTTTASHEEVTTVREIIRAWKPAGTRCEWIIVCFASPELTLGPATGDHPAGDWGAWCSGTPLRPVRESTARYWVGPR